MLTRVTDESSALFCELRDLHNHKTAMSISYLSFFLPHELKREVRVELNLFYHVNIDSICGRCQKMMINEKKNMFTVTFNTEANWASFAKDLKAEMCFGEALISIIQ